MYYYAPYGVVYLTSERLVYAAVPPVEDFQCLAVALNKIKGPKNVTSWLQWALRKSVVSSIIVPIDVSLPGPALAKFYFSDLTFGRSFYQNLKLSTFEGHTRLTDQLPKYDNMNNK